MLEEYNIEKQSIDSTDIQFSRNLGKDNYLNRETSDYRIDRMRVFLGLPRDQKVRDLTEDNIAIREKVNDFLQREHKTTTNKWDEIASDSQKRREAVIRYQKKRSIKERVSELIQRAKLIGKLKKCLKDTQRANSLLQFMEQNGSPDLYEYITSEDEEIIIHKKNYDLLAKKSAFLADLEKECDPLTLYQRLDNLGIHQKFVDLNRDEALKNIHKLSTIAAIPEEKYTRSLDNLKKIPFLEIKNITIHFPYLLDFFTKTDQEQHAIVAVFNRFSTLAEVTGIQEDVTKILSGDDIQFYENKIQVIEQLIDNNSQQRVAMANERINKVDRTVLAQLCTEFSREDFRFGANILDALEHASSRSIQRILDENNAVRGELGLHPYGHALIERTGDYVPYNSAKSLKNVIEKLSIFPEEVQVSFIHAIDLQINDMSEFNYRILVAQELLTKLQPVVDLYHLHILQQEEFDAIAQAAYLSTSQTNLFDRTDFPVNQFFNHHLRKLVHAFKNNVGTLKEIADGDDRYKQQNDDAQNAIKRFAKWSKLVCENRENSTDDLRSMYSPEIIYAIDTLTDDEMEIFSNPIIRKRVITMKHVDGLKSISIQQLYSKYINHDGTVKDTVLPYFMKQNCSDSLRDFLLSKIITPELISFLPDNEKQYWDVIAHSNDSLQSILLHNKQTINHLFHELKHQHSDVQLQPEVFQQIWARIENSPSQEIQRLRNQLIVMIAGVDNPLEHYNSIEQVFVKNYLPVIGKVFKVFQILYPPDTIKKYVNNHKLSPVLTKVAESGNDDLLYRIFYRDLLTIHLESGNRSLVDYLTGINESYPLIEKRKNTLLTDPEKSKLYLTLKKMQFLSQSVFPENDSYQAEGDDSMNDEELDLLIQTIEKNLDVHAEKGETILSKISDIFLKPVNCLTIHEALNVMKNTKETAHKRRTELFQQAIQQNEGYMSLPAGTLLKGIDNNYFNLIWENGSVSKEFLGPSATSDSTPFDTDFEEVSENAEMPRFQQIIESSEAHKFGQLMLVIRDRSMFQHEQFFPGKANKPEVFHTNRLSEQHVGIRTGIGTSKVDFLIAQPALIADSKQLDNIFYSIACHGAYIPVTDITGKIIFSPDDYEKMRRAFIGVSRYDGSPLMYEQMDKDSSHYQEIQKIVESVKTNITEVDRLSGIIRAKIASVLSEFNIPLSEGDDLDLLKAELNDIGSTGRHTSLFTNNDFDFNLTIPDIKKARDIKKRLEQELAPLQDNFDSYTNTSYVQIRALGAQIDGRSIDVDIGIGSKSDLKVYGSDMAISDKLEWIKDHQGEESYFEVLANIIYAKTILKKANAYKKIEDSSLGGIGVENWILANGGNVQKAFQTFYHTAMKNGIPLPLEQFKEAYALFDAGQNRKYKDVFIDNYILYLSETSYRKMLELAVEHNFVSSVKN
ncbi:hypothetical protein HGA88_03655 [Candidatus Roizmanbacteria bacterium]|nr:hypothetical protein [Candidatus Roizmanbacteria bacterium]